MRKALCISAVLLAFPACATEEIATPITTVGTEPGPDRGELIDLGCAHRGHLRGGTGQDAGVARPVQFYGVFVDGRQLVFEGLNSATHRSPSRSAKAAARSAPATSPPARTISRSRRRAAVP